MPQLLDNFDRKIDYLRISITDRCNLRCQYCMPPGGVECKSHEEILRYEEIIKVVRAGVELGIKKVRVTGGEPLTRLGVVGFVRELAEIEGLEDISMTTNGTLLADFAAELKAAGLNRVNISLDSLQREKYSQITRRDEFDKAMAGIKAAHRTGLEPVKLNVVMMKGINDDEIADFVDLTFKYPFQVRFIEFMPLGHLGELQQDRYISLAEIRKEIEKEFKLVSAEVKGNGPAEYFKIDGASGSIGFITPISHNFCSKCNRIRLTADGKLRPCLESDLEIDLREDDGEIGTFEEVRARFRKAIILKPGGHNFFKDKHSRKNMSQIGG